MRIANLGELDFRGYRPNSTQIVVQPLTKDSKNVCAVLLDLTLDQPLTFSSEMIAQGEDLHNMYSDANPYNVHKTKHCFEPEGALKKLLAAMDNLDDRDYVIYKVEASHERRIEIQYIMNGKIIEFPSKWLQSLVRKLNKIMSQ